MWVAVRGRGRGEFLSLENDSGPAIRFVFGNVIHRENGQSKGGSGDRFHVESSPPSSLYSARVDLDDKAQEIDYFCGWYVLIGLGRCDLPKSVFSLFVQRRWG